LANFFYFQIKQVLKTCEENKRTKNLSGMLDLTRPFLVWFSDVGANDESSRENLQEILRKESFKNPTP
jgi:hypothetical protein